MTAPQAATFKPKKSVALSGVTAGNTALCSVGKTGNDLHYRGYDILDVADSCEFEEIAYLLVHGKLPTTAELKGYKAKLKSLRGLPSAVKAALERAVACVEAGADMIFPEAITDLGMYTTFAKAVKVPVLANITEFGATPLFTVDQLRGADVGLVLYPLSAFRAMNKAAENVYMALRRDGTQQNVLDTMQTRMELYESINYHDFEQKLDALFAAQKK